MSDPNWESTWRMGGRTLRRLWVIAGERIHPPAMSASAVLEILVKADELDQKRRGEQDDHPR